jgi:hypothetical protein
MNTPTRKGIFLKKLRPIKAQTPRNLQITTLIPSARNWGAPQQVGILEIRQPQHPAAPINLSILGIAEPTTLKSLANAGRFYPL